MDPRIRLFAACAPGLEPFVAGELQRLGASDIRATPGGVEFGGSRRDLYAANLHLRTANRVLVRMGEFYAAAFSELRKKAGRLSWEVFLQPGTPIALKATCHKSRLYHSDAVAERVAGAIEDRLGRPISRVSGGEPDAPDSPQLVLARLDHDRCTLSVDASGALLHRRGYRLATARAPLRETLAAGMLLASGWDATSPLLDPFCGSGTIAIEAALIAANRAPGRSRRFAFMKWPDFDATLWKSLLAEADEREPLATPQIAASDRDAGAIGSARANAQRAGVADRIDFSCRALSAIEPPPGPGWVVTNPPYGVRIGRPDDLRNLYAQFGKVMRGSCPGWQVVMLCADVRLARASGLTLVDIAAFENSGMRVKLMRGRAQD